MDGDDQIGQKSITPGLVPAGKKRRQNDAAGSEIIPGTALRFDR
jgi:hypothetical protein